MFSFSSISELGFSEEILSESLSSTISITDTNASIWLASFLSSISVGATWDGAPVGIFSDSDVSFYDLTENLTFLNETFSVSDSLSYGQVVFVADFVAVTVATSQSIAFTQKEFSSSIAFNDSLQTITKQSVSELFDVTDTVTIGGVLESIFSVFNVSDEVSPIVTLQYALEDFFSASDSLLFRNRLELADALSFVDTVFAKLHQLLNLLSTFSVDDTVSHNLQIQFVVSDSISVSDSFFETIQRVLEVNDTLNITGVFRIDGEDYVVWGFNPKTLGAYKLKYGLKFNSIQRIGGKNLLCAADGIYEVGGQDDDGTAIAAYLKTGFENFDDPERHYPGEKLKQLLSAYLVLSTEGETLMKVITTRRGSAVETWFKCKEKPSVTSKVQVPLSNSLRSILFQFEIKPLAGKPAKLHEVEIIPLFLSRSI